MGNKTILLVDNDALTRDMIRTVLEREHTILVSSKCSEIKRRLAEPLDLALVDYVLPDGNGFDALKELRRAKPVLPVILMTAYSTENLAIKALRAGVTDYIKKPFSFNYLGEKLSEIFEGKKNEEHAETVESQDVFIIDGIAVIIEDKYTEAFTLDRLAGMAGMNKFKFCRIFKKRHGVSYTSYLNDVRIRNAAHLISGTTKGSGLPS